MQNVVEVLKKYNQKNLIGIYNSLDEEGKIELEKQLEKVDFEEMEKLFSIVNKEQTDLNTNISPIDNVYVK